MFEDKTNIDPYILTKDTGTGELLTGKFFNSEISRGAEFEEAGTAGGGGGGVYNPPSIPPPGAPQPPPGCINYTIIYMPCGGIVDCGDGWTTGGAHSYAWGNASECPIANGECIGGFGPSVEYICTEWSSVPSGNPGGGIYGVPPIEPGPTPPDFECEPDLGCTDYVDLDGDGNPDPYEICDTTGGDNCWQYCENYNCEQLAPEDNAKYELAQELDAIMGSGDSWEFDDTLDPDDAMHFESVQDFED